MNLVSCTNCGVVLDKNNLNFPEDISLEDGSVDLTKAQWDGDTYVPYIECPVCKGKILENE